MTPTRTVIVACKLPNGLIMELVDPPTDGRLDKLSQLCLQMAGEKEQAKRDALQAQMMLLLAGPQQGSRQLLPNPAGERYVLSGSNSLLVHTGTPIGPAAQGTHRYAVTRVPEDFARRWMERNASLECVKRHLVFIVEDPKNAKPEIREKESDPQTRTGLEALAETKDPRMPQPKKPGAPNVATPDVESMAQFEKAAA